MASREITEAELAAHATADGGGGGCWIAIDQRVYDITEWLAAHPGGRAVLLSEAGGDATAMFEAAHGDPAGALQSIQHKEIGILVATAASNASSDEDSSVGSDFAASGTAPLHTEEAHGSLGPAHLHVTLPESIAQMTPQQLHALATGLSATAPPYAPPPPITTDPHGAAASGE